MKKLETKIFKFTLDHCYREYQEQTETWRDIEAKARGMLALCAALLLAGLYVIADPQHPGLLTSIFLGLAFGALFVAITYSSWSLRVQDYESIESSEHVIRSCEQALLSDSGTKQEEEFRKYQDKYLDRWARMSSSLGMANERKARCLARAEGFLFLALLALAVSVVIQLVTNATTELCCAQATSEPFISPQSQQD